MPTVWKLTDPYYGHDVFLWERSHPELTTLLELHALEDEARRNRAISAVKNVFRLHLKYGAFPWTWLGAVALAWYYVSWWINLASPRECHRFTGRLMVSEDWFLYRGLKQ